MTKLIKRNLNEAAKIKWHDIQLECIQNHKLLLDRNSLLEVLPKKGIVAELGVDEGLFSENIIKLNNPSKLYLIDTWETERYNQEKYIKTHSKFLTEIKEGKIEILRESSLMAWKHFPNHYFDFVYIDTDHSYETTLQELIFWKDKIKINGFLTGHDFIQGNWNSVIKYGVIEAVYEFCVKYNWQLTYTTADYKESPSFALKRIDIK